jgi:hypothetical protein
VLLGHDDLALLAAASGQTRQLARLAVEAIFAGAVIDAQIAPDATGYTVTLRVVRAEEIIREVELEVRTNGLPEDLRAGVLLLHLRGVLVGLDRWRRRAALAERAAIEAAYARFGSPPA